MTKSNNGNTSKASLALGVVLLTAAIALTLWFLFWLLSGLSKELVITLVTAVLTIGGAVWVNRDTKLRDRDLQIQAQQASKREKIVSDFIRNFWILLQDEFKSEEERNEHSRKTISDIMINGSVWLSDGTLKKFVEFRLGAQRGDDANTTTLRIARLMLAFREDLGHKNKGLSEKDMLDIFINDTDVFFKGNSER